MSGVASSSSWSSFLKSVTSFNGDLTSLTAPAFILSPTSLSEYSQYWAEHPDLFIAPSLIEEEDPSDKTRYEVNELKRMIAVVRWFIATLRSQYCSRNDSYGTEKKPLNPFLGEVFVGKWEANKDIGETMLLSEQVSHHPPVTAYVISNKKHGVELQGYNEIKANWAMTGLNIRQFGHALLKCGKDKTYLITLPKIHIAGLVTASPFIELEGTSFIQGPNGYIAKMEYTGQGYFSGKKNTFKARIFRDLLSTTKKENALATITGQWSGKSYIAKGLLTPSSKDELFYDTTTAPRQALNVKPVDKQHKLESRRAWSKVADAIRRNDFETTDKEKSAIENHQRDLRKREKELDVTWAPRWFDLVNYLETEGPDPFLTLSNLASLDIHNVPSGTLKSTKPLATTANHWRFNPVKWEQEEEISL